MCLFNSYMMKSYHMKGGGWGERGTDIGVAMLLVTSLLILCLPPPPSPYLLNTLILHTHTHTQIHTHANIRTHCPTHMHKHSDTHAHNLCWSFDQFSKLGRHPAKIANPSLTAKRFSAREVLIEC